jgi:predicted GH43/DUF377 family glycosyl hydrolase
MKKLRSGFFCLLAIQFTSVLASLDLEDLAQDFVLETKQINIPGYPDAFNPCIIPWEDSYLMTFRIIPQIFLTFHSEIGVIRLNKNFEPIGKAQLLVTRTPNSEIYSRAEDARLITIDNELWIVYTDNLDKIISKGGFRVYIAKLIHDGLIFSLEGSKALTKYEDSDQSRREKNWVPFEYQNEILLAYSIHPHKIFRPIIGTNVCETIVTTYSDINWAWGDLRGGTTGLKISETEYLSFFHSSIRMATIHSDDKEMPHYFMAAYTYSTEFPFEVTRVSPEPIIGKNFYHGPVHKPYWGSIRCVFPCGFTHDDDYIWIAYGRQDHETWVVKLDKHGLLNSLHPVPLLEIKISE